MDDHNKDLGNRIFLTWSARLKDLRKAIAAAEQMRTLGTTFRGCSFDIKVSHRDRCPVCGELGENPQDVPYDTVDRSHTPKIGAKKAPGETFANFKKSQGKS